MKRSREVTERDREFTKAGQEVAKMIVILLKRANQRGRLPNPPSHAKMSRKN